MSIDTRILIFATQAGAADAVARISRNMNLTGSTFLYAQPQALADSRWCIPHPSDDDWLAGVTGYSLADGTGLVAVGEHGVVVTVVETLALRDRFSDTEMGTITVAASRALDGGNPSLQMLLDTMGAAVQLDLADSRVQGGFQALVGAGLLSRDRATAILAPVGLAS